MQRANLDEIAKLSYMERYRDTHIQEGDLALEIYRAGFKAGFDWSTVAHQDAIQLLKDIKGLKK